MYEEDEPAVLLIKLIAGIVCAALFAFVLAAIYVLVCLKRNPPEAWGGMGDETGALNDE